MISVIVPTYNEQENITCLLERLDAALATTDQACEVLIIDDNSPDRTAAAAREAGKDVALDVRVIIRNKNPDLSRSVVRGFREAKGNILVVMDADLQHPPEVVPDLVACVNADTPLAIGSRYTSDGHIEDWPVFRQVVSFGAILLAKTLVPPTRGVTDPISGFFAIQADALNVNDLSPNGYKILIGILAAVDPDHVAEIGFVFRNREHGETSLDLEQYYRFLKHVVMTGFKYRIMRLVRRQEHSVN